MITIDGSAGEGGGQVLRTALGLSLVTGRAFHITNIRARRSKPGLMRQHLTAVKAAAEIGHADIKDAKVGTEQLAFSPNTIQPGSYTFSIGTAGSCTLVFQAVLPALLMADGPSELILEGGTHNPMAPPFVFLEHTFLPLLRQMGVNIEASLERPGFFPAGGGRIRMSIEPAKQLFPLELLALTGVSVSARAVCAQLPRHIGERELKVVSTKLNVAEKMLELVHMPEFGPGNIVNIFIRSEQLTETFTGFGQKNISAERVARQAVSQAKMYLATNAPVGPYLADQLLIPMALARSGCFQTGKPTQHTLTNIDIIQRFLEIDFFISQLDKNIWEIRVG